MDLYEVSAVAIPVSNIAYIATNVQESRPPDPHEQKPGMMVKLKSGESVFLRWDCGDPHKDPERLSCLLGGLQWP